QRCTVMRANQRVYRLGTTRPAALTECRGKLAIMAANRSETEEYPSKPLGNRGRLVKGRKKTMRKLCCLISSCVLLALESIASAQNVPGLAQALSCDDNGVLCKDVYDSIGYGGRYTGHDEPALFFYSSVPGSGNSMVYLMQLPKEPPTPPKQDGTG